MTHFQVNRKNFHHIHVFVTQDETCIQTWFKDSKPTEKTLWFSIPPNSSRQHLFAKIKLPGVSFYSESITMINYIENGKN